jgi:FtsP/CotA-like multicopper oxidase with cupredoxin domain
MYLPAGSSRTRVREAENARRNRAEVYRALSTGKVTRRELVKWGIFTSTGLLANINGLSPFATSAHAQVPTGTPRSPIQGLVPFSKPMPRLHLQEPIPLDASGSGPDTAVSFRGFPDELPARRLSYHTEFSAGAGFVNPRTGFGPLDGRPPGEYFAHQRWEEFLPTEGYIMTLGRLTDNTRCFDDGIVAQDPDRIWTFASRREERCYPPPPLVKVRYGQPVIFRTYNALPVDRYQNGGFGSISQAIHNHNAHNASASDGASNAHFYPGQFYDYHWSTCLARHDMTNTDASDPRASGPDGNGGLVQIPGDYRELQSSLWFHDHRFFFTAENVYKGSLGMLNYYSGPDRGNERLADGTNLKLPSGWLLDWGNIDFDVNLIISDGALDQDQQYFFDIFDTRGFLGDLMLVNFAYKPYFEVLPRKYRFRILSAGMSRWVKLVLLNQQNAAVSVQVIANDGNLLPKPVSVSQMDILGTGERFDIVVDFSAFAPGQTLQLVNLLQFRNGTGPDKALSIKDALKPNQSDPAVGPLMQFRVVNQVESVDVPGFMLKASQPDRSRVPAKLTEVIPVVAPVRERILEYKGVDDGERGLTGACFPDCDDREEFPWSIRINGESNHFMNANRVSILVPKPGEVEHWTIVNGSGGSWDHPIHLHFEEGMTINRGGRTVPATEKNARKDVWRLGEGGRVKFQVRFGEFGGAYVNHCHNTVHEDWAMLLRYDVLTDPNNPANSQTHVNVIPTPNPSPGGVTYRTPELLKEGNPFARGFKPFPNANSILG